MKKKKYLMLITAISVSSVFLLNGCSFKLPDLSGGATPISTESENLTEGSVQIHSRWYNSANEKLAGATVSFYDGSELLAEAITDENGNLEAYTLPGNTELKCTVTDSSGTEIANTKVIYKISPDYSAFTVIMIHDESDVQEIEIPNDKTVLSIAMYVTDNKTISHANVTQYDENAATEADQSSDEQTDQPSDGQTAQPSDGQTAQPSDGQAAQPSSDGQAAQPSSDGQTTQPSSDGQAAQPSSDGQTTQPQQ